MGSLPSLLFETIAISRWPRHYFLVACSWPYPNNWRLSPSQIRRGAGARWNITTISWRVPAPTAGGLRQAISVNWVADHRGSDPLPNSGSRGEAQGEQLG